MNVTVELFGVPRLRAGVDRVDVRASTAAEAMLRLAERVPAFAGTVVTGDGRLHPAYRLCVNAERFVAGAETLHEGDTLQLMAADVGG